MAPPDEEDQLAEELNQFSESVKRAVRVLPANQPVTAWSIIRNLCEIHSEYGGKLASELTSRSVPPNALSRPIANWLSELQAMLLMPSSGVIDGRVTILALARLDAALAKELSKTPFLSQLEKELPEPVRWNPEPKSARETFSSSAFSSSSKEDRINPKPHRNRLLPLIPHRFDPTIQPSRTSWEETLLPKSWPLA